MAFDWLMEYYYHYAKDQSFMPWIFGCHSVIWPNWVWFMLTFSVELLHHNRGWVICAIISGTWLGHPTIHRFVWCFFDQEIYKKWLRDASWIYMRSWPLSRIFWCAFSCVSSPWWWYYMWSQTQLLIVLDVLRYDLVAFQVLEQWRGLSRCCRSWAGHALGWCMENAVECDWMRCHLSTTCAHLQ